MRKDGIRQGVVKDDKGIVQDDKGVVQDDKDVCSRCMIFLARFDGR